MSAVLALGVLAALGASVLYCGGAALQALEARERPDSDGLHTRLVRRLMVRPRWVLGTAFVLGGWALQAGSLFLAPLTIVQPTLAVGLVLLLVIGLRMLDEPVGRQEVLAVAAIVLGVTGLALSAPDRSADHARIAILAPTLAVLAVVALVPYAFRSHRYLGALVILSGGLAYALAGFATSFAGQALMAGRWVVFGLWLAGTGIAALTGLVSEMTAFQHAPVTHVFPIMLVIQIAITVVFAPLIAGESWANTPFDGVALAASLGVIGLGAGALVGGRGVGAAMGPRGARSGD